MRYLVEPVVALALIVMPTVGCSEAFECQTDRDCDDQNECTEDVCLTGIRTCDVRERLNGSPCDWDGVPGICTDGVCGENPCEGVVCGDTECKIDGVCNPNDGTCDYTSLGDGAACDFGTLPGVCEGGICVDAMLCGDANCDDQNPCTKDACNPNDGMCEHTSVPDETPCEVEDWVGACIEGGCVVTIEFDPIDDGSIHDDGRVDTITYVISDVYMGAVTRGVVEFPLTGVQDPIDHAALSVNPYALPLHDRSVEVYGYESFDGELTLADFDAGEFLGIFELPEDLDHGEEAFFEVTSFVSRVTSPFVGFSLRTELTVVLSSLEANYGRPSKLIVTTRLTRP